MKFLSLFDIMILLLGLALIVVGLIIWIRQNVSLTLDFNASKIREEDIKKFTSSYGITYVVMGIFMSLLTLLGLVFEGKHRGISVLIYIIAYIAFMQIIKKIQRKYETYNV
ncbi:MAG: hypothetical protein GX237_01820 [Clostridiales bacterium]|nr:hypothetical protein [Clostridiales bacterium]